MKRLLLAVAVATLTAVGVSAQQDNEFTVDAELRTRGEHNNGAVIPRIDQEQAANFINERARLSVSYKRSNLQLKASVQHTGVWGQDAMNQDNGRATMNEAWARMNFGDHFFAQLGRMALDYDDGRLLGSQDWSVSGSWHDALRLGYEDQHNRLHGIVAMNQTAENNRGDYYAGPMPYKSMQVLWYQYQSLLLPLRLSAIGINVGRELGTQGHGMTWYQQTVGANVSFQPMKWGLNLAGYYQMGTNSDGRDVQAWMASARLLFDLSQSIALYAGYDYLSGNKDIQKVNAFNGLYGSYHDFYGAMDYFPGYVYCGLNDIHGGVDVTLGSKMRLKADYHYFMAAEDVRGNDRPLGHEIDFQFAARLMKDVTLRGGYSVMFAKPAINYVKGAGSSDEWQDWAWLQLSISPRIFSTKW